MKYNHFILNYIVDKFRRSNKKEHKVLIMIALDFKKAYDSINRGKLIETLVKFKIHPALIDLVARVYSGDKTTIRMEGKEVVIRITSGIKQGCTASTVSFKLITFLIIDHLEREGMMINVEGLKIN